MGDPVRAYVATTGAVFGLLTLVHIWRIMVEGVGPARDPRFILLTLLAAGLALWAWRVLRQSRRHAA
jgi:hypothetical protein